MMILFIGKISVEKKINNFIVEFICFKIVMQTDTKYTGDKNCTFCVCELVILNIPLSERI